MLRNELVYPTATKMYLADPTTNVTTKASAATYKRVLGLLQRSYPDRRVSEFTADDVQAFVAGPTSKGEPASSATINLRKSILTQFFRWAAWRGLTATDPTLGLDRLIRVKRRPVRQNVWMTEAQVAAVLEGARKGPFPERDEALLLVGVLTGLRASELASLTWGAVDLEAGTITALTKGGKLRTVGLPGQARAALLALKARGPVRTPDMPLFPRLRQVIDFSTMEQTIVVVWDEGMNGNSLSKVVGKICRRGGVQGVAAHDLRRTFAGILESKGKDVLAIQRALGHENVGTTQRYMEQNPRKVLAVTQDLELDLHGS